MGANDTVGDGGMSNESVSRTVVVDRGRAQGGAPGAHGRTVVVDRDVVGSEMSDEALEQTIAAEPGAGTRSRLPSAPLPRGAMIGRYVILTLLATGGMGVVYAAYDPELDRKVALKLVLPGADASPLRTLSATRLLREAKALAKLSHPAVVSIHDVGTVDDSVFIAMEFLEGRTLGAWSRETQRSWQEVLDVMRPAGEGLAAAHAVGLLHRDFKPDNVMVGSEGRVRVMDFGLARTDNQEPAPSEHAKARPRRGALNVELTVSGALMGTPAYMAPEQFSDDEVTAAADQFAFCIALWELLYGERPFHGTSLTALSTAVIEGRRRPPPRGARVPAWLLRVCERGLSPRPRDRYPSLRQLLDELATGQRRHAKRWRLYAGAGLALLGATGAGYRVYDDARQRRECRALGAAIEGVWSEDARARLRGALAGSGVSYAETTTERVLPWLDAYAREWNAARTEACLDAGVRDVWSADTEGRAGWCLDERRLEFGALVTALSQGEAQVVEHAVLAAAGLPRIEPCRDERVLARLVAPPDGRGDEVQHTRGLVSESRAMNLAGFYARGAEAAADALERAQELAWPPLVAAARVQVGLSQEDAGDYDASTATLQRAFFEATESGASEVAAAAATTLITLAGHHAAEFDAGLLWGQHARAELVRAGVADDDLRWVGLNNGLAIVKRRAGAYDDAIAYNETSIALVEKALGPDHPLIATSLLGLANSYRYKSAHARARALYERVLSIQEGSLGADHPYVAHTLNNLAIVDMDTGAYDDATRYSERALAIRIAALGPDHPYVAHTVTNLGMIATARGELDEASALHERAVNIMKRSFGPDHPNVAQGINNLAMVHFERGAYDEAKALHERALGINESALSPDHPTVALSLHNLGDVELVTGAYAEARERLTRALAIRERALGPTDPHVADSLTSLAEVELGQGRLGAARTLAERALEIRDGGGTSRVEKLARTRFALARALLQSDLPRGRTLAQQAAEDYKTAGKTRALADVERWLVTVRDGVPETATPTP